MARANFSGESPNFPKPWLQFPQSSPRTRPVL